MRRIAVSAVAASLAAALAGGAGATVTPARATACLTAGRALVKTAPRGRDYLYAPAIEVSFALVPGQRLDDLVIAFERDHATASAVAARIVARFQPKVPSIRRYIEVKGNAVISWNTPNHTAASRAVVLRCL